MQTADKEPVKPNLAELKYGIDNKLTDRLENAPLDELRDLAIKLRRTVSRLEEKARPLKSDETDPGEPNIGAGFEGLSGIELIETAGRVLSLRRRVGENIQPMKNRVSNVENAILTRDPKYDRLLSIVFSLQEGSLPGYGLISPEIAKKADTALQAYRSNALGLEIK